MAQHRLERDPLGPVHVPAEAYYGAQTARAVENFPISGLRAHPDLITGTILVKKAAAEANAGVKTKRQRRQEERRAGEDRADRLPGLPLAGRARASWRTGRGRGGPRPSTG